MPARKRGSKPKRRLPVGVPGASPGTLVAPEGAAASVVTLTRYDVSNLEERRLDSSEDIVSLLQSPEFFWLNVDGLADVEFISQLGKLLGFHPLALEDVFNVGQRPKVEEYDGSLFIVLRIVSLRESLQSEQVSLFLGKNYVVTFQERQGDCFEPVRARIRKQGSRIRRSGSDYLAYALMDAAVDNLFPVVEEYGERLDRMQERVLVTPDRQALDQILRTRRELLSLRRSVWPLREAVGTLYRDPIPLIEDETRTFFRDCYDHAIQAMDLIENYREIASGLMDIYLSSLSNRMNEVMKVLTVIATIFIPLSFIAGVYGMNFDRDVSTWNMPELGWTLGYPFALLLMAVTAVGMLLYIRRQRWIGSGSGSSDEGRS